jgi:hypothetical protein
MRRALVQTPFDVRSGVARTAPRHIRHEWPVGLLRGANYAPGNVRQPCLDSIDVNVTRNRPPRQVYEAVAGWTAGEASSEDGMVVRGTNPQLNREIENQFAISVALSCKDLLVLILDAENVRLVEIVAGRDVVVTNQTEAKLAARFVHPFSDTMDRLFVTSGHSSESCQRRRIPAVWAASA